MAGPATPAVLRPLTVPHESLRPPSADNPRLGVAMSLLAHGALVAGLTLGVQWRSEETPVGVEAELWAATPQLAAPPAPTEAAVEAPPPPPPEPVRAAPPPPPPPAAAEREAEIALEKAALARKEQERKEQARKEAEDRRAREQREQAERDRKAQAEKDRQTKLKAEQDAQRQKEQARAEQQKREKAEEAKKEKAAEAAREKLRQEQMQRMNAQLGGTGAPGSTGTAARDAGPSANYAGRIKARIKPNIVLTEEVSGNPTAEVEVKVAADGNIIGRRISKPSGNKAWDEAVLRAIDRTAVLPRDTDGRVPPTMVISFRPQE